MEKGSKLKKRIGWDEYFMNMLDNVALRSTCLRRQVAAIIVKDNRIVATGYNGQPPGMKHCTERGFCLREKLRVPSGQRHELCRAVHAEENAILQASHFGVSLKGSILYINDTPCSYCMKSILSVGISRVVYGGIYPDDLAEEMRREATWVKFEQYKSPIVGENEVHLYLDEEIKLIKDYDGYYVSNYGRVFKGSVFKKGDVIELEERIKNICYGGRYFVDLKSNRSVVTKSVALLVAEIWVDNPNNWRGILWKDGDCVNNHVSNLMWWDEKGVICE